MFLFGLYPLLLCGDGNVWVCLINVFNYLLSSFLSLPSFFIPLFLPHLFFSFFISVMEPYICDFPGCGKPNRRKFNHNRHIATHARHLDTSLYTCAHCGLSYTRKDNLKRHVSTQCLSRHLNAALVAEGGSPVLGGSSHQVHDVVVPFSGIDGPATFVAVPSVSAPLHVPTQLDFGQQDGAGVVLDDSAASSSEPLMTRSLTVPCQSDFDRGDGVDVNPVVDAMSMVAVSYSPSVASPSVPESVAATSLSVTPVPLRSTPGLISDEYCPGNVDSPIHTTPFIRRRPVLQFGEVLHEPGVFRGYMLANPHLRPDGEIQIPPVIRHQLQSLRVWPLVGLDPGVAAPGPVYRCTECDTYYSTILYLSDHYRDYHRMPNRAKELLTGSVSDADGACGGDVPEDVV